MEQNFKQKIKSLLIKHESYRQFPYIDTTGHITIGIGRNLSDRGISITEAFQLLDEDINYFYDKLLYYLPCFSHLNEPRQIALIDMCYNVGIQGLLNFHEMIKELESSVKTGNFDKVSEEMLNSKWAVQVGKRANLLADIIRKGEL